jgi:UDP-4-amino-4,6-dideoxy-N-acetyl-beta-L-altrosamine transaminase
MTEAFLPYGRQSIEADDIAAVVEVLKGDWLTTGPAVSAFEENFAERLGAAQAVACSSGTAALHLASLGLELGAGDTVIAPAMSFSATANGARYTGAEVIFADVDPDSGMMGAADFIQAVERAGDASVRAVFPVHLNGQCAAPEAIAAIARDRSISVIEDACHAIGADYGDGRPIGACAHSDMAMFSLHGVKTMTAGEGGVLTTNDSGLAARLRRLRNHGITREAGDFRHADMAFGPGGAVNPWYYELQELGLNYRLTDIQCALANSQLAKLDRFVARRRDLASRYDQLLAPLAPLVRPVARSQDCRPAWHLYAVLIDFEAAAIDRGRLMGRLREAGIGTQVHYIPIHLQPYYRERYGDIALPGAMAYYERCLSLPLFPAMVDGDVERVVECLGRALEDAQ